MSNTNEDPKKDPKKKELLTSNKPLKPGQKILKD